MVAIREATEQSNELLFDTALKSLTGLLPDFFLKQLSESIFFVSIEHGILSISTLPSFDIDWLKYHYRKILIDGFQEVFKQPIELNFIQRSNQTSSRPILQLIPGSQTTPVRISSSPSPYSFLTPPFVKTPNPQPAKAPPSQSMASPYTPESCFLDSAYTFDNFAHGASNQMGFSACYSAAEKPGTQYSPLFLFGPVGTGKTHLLQAVGLQALKKNPFTRIVYTTTEQWVNGYISAIREKRFDTFRKKFRSECDILLVDDIQFLAGKEACQDEFFHTFNSLHQDHKQIVITGDCYPHEIEGLEPRLQTRLSWGLIADIRIPELPTRKEIIRKKAAFFHLILQEDIVQYLAEKINGSVRELESALLRISAFSSVIKTPITLNMAKDCLSPVLQRPSISSNTSLERICEHVAHYYGLQIADLKGQSRQRHVALARQVAMYICRKTQKFSFPEIGRFFGGRDHSTVMASVYRIEHGSIKNFDRGIVEALEAELNSSYS